MEKKENSSSLFSIYLTGIDNEGTVFIIGTRCFPTFHDSSNFSLFEASRRKYYGLLTFYPRERLPIYIYTNFNLALIDCTTCLHRIYRHFSPGRVPVLRSSLRISLGDGAFAKLVSFEHDFCIV